MGIKLAVVSDAPSREAWMRIYYLNLHHVFDLVLTIDDTGAGKPSSKPFAMALDSLKIKAGDAIMVGDWPERDVEGAKKVGMRTIFARYGDTFDTKHSGADWDVNDIYEIVGIIKELNGAWIFIGTDILSVLRIREILDSHHKDRFNTHTFTKSEIDYCEGKANPSIHYAGRFAAKEAIKKPCYLLE